MKHGAPTYGGSLDGTGIVCPRIKSPPKGEINWSSTSVPVQGELCEEYPMEYSLPFIGVSLFFYYLCIRQGISKQCNDDSHQSCVSWDCVHHRRLTCRM